MNRNLLAVLGFLALLFVFAIARDAFRSPPAPTTAGDAAARPEPVTVDIGGEKRAFRVDALLSYGATPFAEICPSGASEAKPDDAMRAMACGADASLSMAAGFRLVEASKLEGAEREKAVRDTNGLVLEALRRPMAAGSDALGGMSSMYVQMGGEMRDARLQFMAAEIAEIDAALCDAKQAPACASTALESVGSAMTEAGRETNDFKRLVRAGELLRRAVDALPKDHDAEDRAEMLEDLGSAYNYAAHFEPEGGKVKWLNLAIAAGEENMPFAEAHAPSFTSARIWSNLGAVYASRGGDATGSEDFRRAVALYDKALGYFKRDEDPEGFAKTTQNRASARSTIATDTRDLALHDQAIADHETALRVFDDENDAFDAAYGRYRLAKALEGRAQTAVTIRNARAAGGPSPETLTRVATDSVSAGLAALDIAEPVLRTSGSAHYLRSLEDQRQSLRRLQETLVKEPG